MGGDQAHARFRRRPRVSAGSVTSASTASTPKTKSATAQTERLVKEAEGLEAIGSARFRGLVRRALALLPRVRVRPTRTKALVARRDRVRTPGRERLPHRPSRGRTPEVPSAAPALLASVAPRAGFRQRTARVVAVARDLEADVQNATWSCAFSLLVMGFVFIKFN